MCFSPEADFVSGAVIGLVGVASLREARHPREVPLAALPLAFALHQITEGFVWLVTALYIVATCGSFVLSSQRRIVWFGVANAAAVATIVRVQSEGLTSLWCLWAGIVSVLIYLQLRDWRDAEEGQPALA